MPLFTRFTLLVWVGLLCGVTALAAPVIPPLTDAPHGPTAWPVTDDGPATLVRSGVSALFAGQVVQTRLARAARLAYLEAEALDLGAEVSRAAQSDRDTAAAIFAYLNSKQRYVEELRLQDLTVLPTGMRKTWNGGNSSFEMGILKARFERDRAFLTVFVRLRLPSPDPNSEIKERELFFGADDVEFTRNGGLVGDFKLVLLGDFIQPLGNVTLRFLGGLNRFSGATDNLTYITISCEQLAAFRLTADVILPRTLVVPIDANTGVVNDKDRVTGRVSVSIPKFPHFLASVSLSPFAITGQEKWGFLVGGATIDLSDLENPPGFPSDYLAKNAGNSPDGNPLRWQGVHIGALRVLLPGEFEEAGKTERTKLDAYNLIVDRTGVSGRVEMQGVPLQLTASGWAMSLSRFRLDFERSKLVGGGFGGTLRLPIAPDDSLAYNALIDAKGDYLVTLSPVRQVGFKLWRARAAIDRSSVVALEVKNGKFRPKAILHGSLGIYTSLKGTEIKDTTARAPIKFEGVVFQGLKLQTEVPYVSASYFGYEGEIKMAGFPLSVTRFGLAFGTANATTGEQPLGLRVGTKVSLMENAFSGETDLTIQGLLKPVGNLQQYSFDRIIFNGICIKGTTATFALDGCVSLFEDDPDYGDAFGGRIKFEAKGAGKAGIKGASIAAIFGAKTGYRYWFVSGGVNLATPVPLLPPLSMNAFYLTAYHNMREAPGRNRLPLFQGASASPYANVSFLPDESLHLGFKGVVGLVAGDKKAFNGSAALEMTFSRHSGLNSVGFYGEGTLISSFSNLTGGIMGKLEKLPRQSEVRDELTPEFLKKKAADNETTFKSGGAIYGRLAMLYDRPNETLSGDAEVFIKIGQPPLAISGVGPGGRAGWMKMLFSPDKWFVHVGTPTDRVGVRVGMPGVNAQASSYFMVGQDIPDMPAPPAEITRQLRNYTPRTVRSAEDKAELGSGSGVAFGTSMALNWDIDLWIPYIRANANVGFDMMLRNNTNCRPAEEFYGRGQVFGLLQGEAGVKFLGRRPLITLGAAFLMEAGMPDPSWFKGEVALYLELGRRFRKTVDFDLALNKDNICQ